MKDNKQPAAQWRARCEALALIALLNIAIVLIGALVAVSILTSKAVQP